MSNALKRLYRALGYQFKDQALLELALTHRSLGKTNYERLEFLGDSILNFVIAEALYHKFPQAKEGQLSRLRAGLVKGVTLAEIAREKQFGDYLRLGSGELKSGGFNRDSILADAVESIIGAIYLDTGLDACKARILDWFEPRLSDLSLEKSQKDAKTRLQEFLQARQQVLPEYELLETVGQDHEQTFLVECKLPDNSTTQGKGSSRRMAEQKAAAAALKALGEKV